MILPGLPRFFCWVVAISVHELLFLGALSIDRDCVETFTVEPDLHCTLEESQEYFTIDRQPDWTCRWPMYCDHQALRRLSVRWPEEVMPDTRCGVCGWPWGALRAALHDRRLPDER